MKLKRLLFPYCVLISIFIMLPAGPVYSQQASNDEAGVQKNKEQVFKIEGRLLELLESKIPEDQFPEIQKEVEGKELSLAKLWEILQTVNISYEDVQTLLKEADEQLKYFEKVKAIRPIALSMHGMEKKIEKLEKELKDAQSDDVKEDISNKLKELQAQLSKSGDKLGNIASRLQEGQLEELAGTLEYLKYNAEESEIILAQVRTQVDLLRKISTIESIIESMDKIREEIAKKEKEIRAAQTEEEKAKLSEELKKMGERLKTLDHDYTTVITGIDMDLLYVKQDKKVSWEKELQEVFSPIIVQLKQVTERPRQMEMLNSAIVYYENRLPRIQKAVKEIETLKKDVSNIKVYKRLEQSEDFWKQQETEFKSKLETARHQLFALEKSEMTFSEVMDFILQSVLGPRVMSIFYSVIALLGTFLVIGIFRLLILKLNPLQRLPKYKFLGSLIDVFLHIFSLFAATAAMAIVLYIYGNWLFLGIVVLIALGLIWAARNTLPQFVKQIELLLGFGTVRQGERVVYNGISYMVESIGIYCYLKNPLLTGGTVRLPLKDLINMRSRPYDESEAWFPCKEGDWIVLNGNFHRQILIQTPEIIKFDYWDEIETMPTSQFLNQNILNLSEKSYWAGCLFNIDPKHRYFDYNDAVNILEKTGEEFLKTNNELYGKEVDYVWVTFNGIGDGSTLRFGMWGLVSGQAGYYWNSAHRLLNQAALKAANENDWEIISFTHVSVQHPDTTKKIEMQKNEG